MTAIEMRLLGPFEVRHVAGRPLAVRAKKNRALLAALAMASPQSGNAPRQGDLPCRAVAQARPHWWLGQVIYAASLVQGGRPDEAHRIVEDLKSQQADAHAPEIAMLPFARPADRDRLMRDLASAGSLQPLAS